MKCIKPEWPAPPRVQALTTTKLADTTCPSELQSMFNLPNKPVLLHQTHSTSALYLATTQQESEGDASYTTTPTLVCAVKTADCLPVLISATDGEAVAAIHAGWRGLANGIIANTIAKLPKEHDYIAWLGPAISQKQFEVGPDVFTAFTEKDKRARAAFIQTAENKWHADLYHIARLQLQDLGVKDIYGGNYCTYSDDNLFYSYRRDQQQTGRLISMIWISND